jgi:pimeloyl-ACP methyl ester carboxylesterase
MDFVTSADGTRIAYERSGTGPAIVLLGGACYGARAWAAVAGLLAPRRTVYALDRRGRGASGDADGFNPAHEVADVRALLAEIGEPVELFGHSSGALLALRVAQTTPVTGMVLYEPPLRVPGGAGADGVTPELIELLARGDREGALTTFMTRSVGLTEPMLTAMRRSSFWATAVMLAHTLPYDTRLHDESGPVALDVPALLLLGEASPARMRTSVLALHDVLPRSELRILPGQGHNALREAPDLLAEQVLAYQEDRK